MASLKAPSTSLTITNPLVLYKALLSTRKIHPDPAQHRLALQLQRLYFRLKDYEPETEFRYRLERAVRLNRKATACSDQSRTGRNGSEKAKTEFEVGEEIRQAVDEKGRKLQKAWWKPGTDGDNLSLTRTVPLHDSAKDIESPQGMLLYGEVGRGKSMLLDLLYDSLPTKKKRRWHFNTFMLDIFRRLELARIERSLDPGASSAFGVSEHEHVVLGLARETMDLSPILFLDEFQLPDRVAGRLVNSFLMAFFHLGGVLVASSNRMPDELAKAQGVEFGKMGGKGDQGLWGRMMKGFSEGQRAARSDFRVFVEVLKKRCEVWEMEGERDWRREDRYDSMDSLTEEEKKMEQELLEEAGISSIDVLPASEPNSSSRETIGQAKDLTVTKPLEKSSTISSSDTPAHYHVVTMQDHSPGPATSYIDDLSELNPSNQWSATTLKVYARPLHLPTTSAENGVVVLPFDSICAANLGPADYISICSTFHTLVIPSIPVLTTLQKNEARRFITLLDACYESRCRLLIEAAAPPDRLFFPETRTKSGQVGTMLEDTGSDSIESEAFSEMYQDSTAPFRPNVSVYDDTSSSPTMSLHRKDLRNVLADEDADFGPTYGNGRGYGPSNSQFEDNDNGDIDMPGRPRGFAELERRQGPDFTQTGALTGEDERFAYKRARSRLWEMCGKKWWDARQDRDPADWWTPVRREGRFWEKTSAMVDEEVMNEVKRTITGTATGIEGSHDGRRKNQSLSEQHFGRNTSNNPAGGTDNSIFKHGASPFRTAAEPPPKFGWQHAWGMMQWGKKAGEWGKGVDGNRNKNRNGDAKQEEQT